MRARGLAVVRFGKQVAQEFKQDDVSGLAAELTYRAFLALFPFLLFLAALGGVLADVFGVQNPADKFLQLFGDSLPADAQSVIHGQVEAVVSGSNFGLLSVGIIGALWAASGGAAAVIKALNRAYDIPDSRPFWRLKLLSVGLVLAATVAIIGGVALIFATQIWGQDLADSLGLGYLFELGLRIGAWPLLVFVLLVCVSFVYWAAPNVGLPYRWVTAGAFFFAVGWAVATVGFGIYVSNFASYNATYGALGGVVVLLLWFYITFTLLLLGAEVNAVLDEGTIGPLLEARRQKAAEELAAKSKAHAPDTVQAPLPAPPPAPSPASAAAPGMPSGVAARPAVPVLAAGAAPAAAAVEAPTLRPGGLVTGVLALTGIVAAALAVRRFVR